MLSIIAGTVLLAFVHALIPNHWLPLVAMAKAEKWDKTDLQLIAAIAASAHVLGTVLLGVLLGTIGQRLAHEYDAYIHIIAPVLLIVLGLIYFSINYPSRKRLEEKGIVQYKNSRKKWVVIFVLMMFLSPCLEAESLFLAAGAYGFDNILLLSLVYAVISITGIVTLVMLAFKGVQLIHSAVIEQHEKHITGMILMAVGIVTFFIH